MYRCQNCGKQSKAGDRATRVVLTYRSVTYLCEGSPRKGQEPVREALLCAACAKWVTPHVVEGDEKVVESSGCYTAPRHYHGAPIDEDGAYRMDYQRNVLPTQAVDEEDIFWVWDPKTNRFTADYPLDGPGPQR